LTEEIRKRLFWFLGLTAAFSTVFLVVIARAGSMQAGGGLYVLGLMWCPGLAALLTQLVTRRTLRGLGWRWGRTRYQMLSVAVPAGGIAVAYGLIWVTGLGRFPNRAFVETISGQLDFPISTSGAVALYAAISGTFAFLTTVPAALGEEIGWRGFLVPELSKVLGFGGTAVVSGLIWAVWHYPGMIFADYGSGVPLWYGMMCFTVMAVGFSVVMAWLRMKSGSVWTAAFAHAAHNVLVQTIFTPLTADTGTTAYWIDEFGAGLAIAYGVAALVFWRLKERLR
jgi:membrane protease YdiL (CAAX protease family)